MDLDRVGDGPRLATSRAAVTAPVTFPRSKRLGRIARLMVVPAVLGGLVAVFATARAAHVEPAVPLAPQVTAVEDEVDHAPDPWTLSSTSVERIGYLRGQRHVFDVVPLGPTAVEVEIGTARAFLAMRAAAGQAGVDLRLESGFRTVEQQQELYRAFKKGRGNKAARPGMSNHQSGRALDIAVGAEPGAFAWLESNAVLFGFKRTVANEPWHWEYVESPIARGEMKRVKRTAHATRPAHRPTATKARASRGRVASSRR